MAFVKILECFSGSNCFDYSKTSSLSTRTIEAKASTNIDAEIYTKKETRKTRCEPYGMNSVLAMYL
jgi:hypothetical protein